MNNDFVKWLMTAKSLLTKVLLVLFVLSLFLIGANWFLGLFTSVIILALMLGLHSLCIVMPGNAAYMVVLGKLMDYSIPSGLRFMVPFISSVTEVDVRLQKFEAANVMKNANLREVTLKYTLTYRVNEKLVHKLHEKIGVSEYISVAIAPWLDTAMTAIISSKTYEDINGHLDELAKEIEDKYIQVIETECGKLSLSSMTSNLFINLKLSITEVLFDKEYTQSIADLATAEKDREIADMKVQTLKITAEGKAEAQKIQADADAYSIKQKAEAEAEGMKLKGASENEVREKLGVILKSHPELIKEVLAKNFPKVYGGANPMMSIDEFLK